MNADRTRREGWWLGLLVALRVAYLGQYLELPFLFGPLFDSQVYLQQAAAVRSGQLADPTLLAFSPLYGYFLAALGARAGSLLPLLAQLLLGVGNVLLVRSIGRRCFGERAGLWAAVAWSLYGPVLFFESKLMSETLGLSLLLLAVDRFASPEFAAGRGRTVFGCGVLLALAVLARASLLPCVPCFVAFALLRDPGEGQASHRQRALRALGLALGVGLVLGSYGTFNKLQAGIFVPVIMVSNTASQASQSDWSGDLSTLNQERPVSAYNVVEQATERLSALRRGEPDPAASRGAAQGVDLSGWLRQLPNKASMTLRDKETSFDYGYYGERSEVPLLHLTFASFGLLASLALVGGLLSARSGSWRALLALAPVVLGIFLTTTLFHPSTRYRLPLLISFAVLTGLTLARAEQAIAARSWRLPLLVALLTGAFAIRNAARGLEHPGMWELRVAESAAMAGDLPECRSRVAAAFAREPGSDAVLARARYVTSLQPGCATSIPR